MLLSSPTGERIEPLVGTHRTLIDQQGREGLAAGDLYTREHPA